MVRRLFKLILISWFAKMWSCLSAPRHSSRNCKIKQSKHIKMVWYSVQWLRFGGVNLHWRLPSLQSWEEGTRGLKAVISLCSSLSDFDILDPKYNSSISWTKSMMDALIWFLVTFSVIFLFQGTWLSYIIANKVWKIATFWRCIMRFEVVFITPT